MPDDITSRPLIETLLEGQQQLSSMIAEFGAALLAISQKQDEFALKLQEFAAKQDEFAAKQDQLDARVTALTREVRDGFDEYNRKINALTQRLLSFEVLLGRLDDRLHDEIIARTR